MGDDQMIVNGHAHQLSSLDELPRDAAGFRVARRMVVQADNRGGVCQDRRTEHCARLDDGSGRAARADLRVAHHDVRRVEKDDPKLFT